MGGMVVLLLGQSIGKNILKTIEALVIFKKVQFALDILTDTNFIAELKEMSGSGKTEQEHVPHFLHKT